MSALLTPRPRAREERRTGGQASLFGDPATIPEQAVPAAPAPGATPAPAGVTLDAAITSLWTRLSADAAAACPVCEAPMETRHSAGAGVVGGRCRSCGSTLS
jgi:hypothetical protein